MTASRERALIALRSFPSVAAAARSMGTNPMALLRLTLGDDELSVAYEECLSGVIRQRQLEEQAAENRQKKAEKPRVTVRTAERRKARFLAAIGEDPRKAAAILHARLNREKRQEKAADIEAALDAVDEIIAGKRDLAIPTKKMLDVFDRWCANCKSHRVDDPCEVCNRKTLIVKGDGS